MATAKYDIGDTIRFKVTFRNVDGALEDPVDPTILILEPDATETEHLIGALTKISTGVFYRDHVADQAGDWYGRGKCADPFITAAEVKAIVAASAFATP